MSFINLRELSKMVGSIDRQDQLQETVERYQKKYGIKVQFQDLLTLPDSATRINKRQKSKVGNGNSESYSPNYEIFCFGELKIFNWVLVLHGHQRNLDIQFFKEEDSWYLQSIFKKKTINFIKYQLQDLINLKKKNSQWCEQEENLFIQIVKNFKRSQEWKAVSFELYKRSAGKYFRSFQDCREMWINHLNPNIKKTDWTPEEDLELFTLILQHGCRWALISRELNGIRSEHSVKNRYNSLMKTMKKQYRLGDTNQLNQKIHKYLKLKLQKQSEKEERLNCSGDSMDSKGSRQRSREEFKNQLNLSQLSYEAIRGEIKIVGEEKIEGEQRCLFGSIYDEHQNIEITNNNKLSYEHEVAILKENYDELKEEKKTNDRDEEEEETSKKLTQAIQELGEQSSEVKTMSLDELEREYNRLMNFDVCSEEPSLCLFDEVLELGSPIPSSCWLNDQEFKMNSWLDFDE